ncbi:MAG: hypothetical protein WDN31_19950 [Hyphomicrobium sp.]
MVHGNCKSVGCYAMTDALMEEIYALARESLKHGQDGFEVHAFPFRMTEANLAPLPGQSEHAVLEEPEAGLRLLEKYRLTPTVAVCERRYVVNVKLPQNVSYRPDGPCPRFQRPVFEPFTPRPFEQQIAEERVVVPGPKTRQFADVVPQPAPAAAPGGAAFGQSYGLGAPVEGAPVETGSTGAPPLGLFAVAATPDRLWRPCVAAICGE